jgi:hypothetical protein
MSDATELRIVVTGEGGHAVPYTPGATLPAAGTGVGTAASGTAAGLSAPLAEALRQLNDTLKKMEEGLRPKAAEPDGPGPSAWIGRLKHVSEGLNLFAGYSLRLSGRGLRGAWPATLFDGAAQRSVPPFCLSALRAERRLSLVPKSLALPLKLQARLQTFRPRRF